MLVTAGTWVCGCGTARPTSVGRCLACDVTLKKRLMEMKTNNRAWPCPCNLGLNKTIVRAGQNCRECSNNQAGALIGWFFILRDMARWIAGSRIAGVEGHCGGEAPDIVWRTLNNTAVNEVAVECLHPLSLLSLSEKVEEKQVLRRFCAKM